MTEKLYYADPERLEFDAAVVRAVPLPDGRHEVVLDRTCFYPGAGASRRTGARSAGAAVLDVREEPDGEIVHVLQGPIPRRSGTGAVDAARRRDFMAQHTGEHIFSQALLRAGGLETVSVHFGDDDTTIEVKAEAVEDGYWRRRKRSPTASSGRTAVVIHHEIDRSEVSRFPLRRTPPEEEQRLRIVEVEGFDWVGCGGVHVRSTGDVVAREGGLPGEDPGPGPAST